VNSANITKEEIQNDLGNDFLPLDRIVLQQNVPMLNLNGKTIVLDTAAGSLNLPGPDTGRLIRTPR
jgi:hypothetical protein